MKYWAIIKSQQTSELPQDVVKDNEVWAQVAAEACSDLQSHYLDLLLAQMMV